MKKQTFQHFFSLSTGLLLALACLFAVPLQAQNNPKISVQGTLKTANGVTVADGSYDVTFNLYNVTSGGTALWSEDASVEVVGGIYSHYLGTSTPLKPADFAGTLYLGVKVGNYELVPRTELSYAPYAFSVANAQSALSANEVVCSGAVGDVKYSILNPTEFAKVNGNCWIPMDGRSISGSKLTQHGVSSIPNAGGLFLRAQEFSNSSDNDPDRNSNSSIATVQSDDFKKHNHGSIQDRYISKVETKKDPTNYGAGTIDVPAGGSWTSQVSGSPGYLWTGDNDDGGGDTYGIDFYGTNASHSTSDTGHTETRPKNINLYIYIRIN